MMVMLCLEGGSRCIKGVLGVERGEEKQGENWVYALRYDMFVWVSQQRVLHNHPWWVPFTLSHCIQESKSYKTIVQHAYHFWVGAGVECSLSLALALYHAFMFVAHCCMIVDPV